MSSACMIKHGHTNVVLRLPEESRQIRGRGGTDSRVLEKVCLDVETNRAATFWPEGAKPDVLTDSDWEQNVIAAVATVVSDVWI